MKIIKGSSKTGQRWLASTSKSQGSELYHVYGRWSAAKERAMQNCKRACLEDKGYDFRITGYNSNRFTVAWNYINKETGEVMTRIETADNTYIIDGSRADNTYETK